MPRGQESTATKENSSVSWHQTLITVKSLIFSLLSFPFINISQESGLNGKKTYKESYSFHLSYELTECLRFISFCGNTACSRKLVQYS